jgi:DNA-binding transcriptional LysR family regulator
MAASGIGVALIPTLALVSSRSDVVVLPVRGRAPSRQIVAVARTGDDNPLVEHMVEALRTAAHKLAGRPALTVVA